MIRLAREAEARRISLQIDESLKAERQQQKKKIVRLLLLGQSESGMSPLLLLPPPSPITHHPQANQPPSDVRLRPPSPHPLPHSFPQIFKDFTPHPRFVKSASYGAASYNSTSSAPSAPSWTPSQTYVLPPSTAAATTATKMHPTFPTKSTCSECVSLLFGISKLCSSPSSSHQPKTTSLPLSEASTSVHTNHTAARPSTPHGAPRKSSSVPGLLGKAPSPKVLAETVAPHPWEIPP